MMNTSVYRKTLPLIFLTLFAAKSYSQEDPTYDLDLKNKFLTRASAQYELAPHSSDLLGEQFDLTTGSVRFERVDGSVPGNSSLEVAYRTSFGIQTPERYGWVEEMPRIESDYLTRGSSNVYKTPGWDSGAYCSGDQTLPIVFGRYVHPISQELASVWVSADYYSPSMRLVVPGKVSSKLLRNYSSAKLGLDTTAYDYVTKEKWRVTCYAVNSAEGFKATSPDGVTYYFDVYHEPQLDERSISVLDWKYVKHRATLMVSRIEDRFGNFVDYNYNGGEISSIVASDGRQVTISRNGAVKTMTSNGRSWVYTTAVVNDREQLTVVRPDGRQWHYDLFQTSSRQGDEDGASCDPAEIWPAGDTMTVTHPDGTVGTFDFDMFENGRVNVPNIFLVDPYPGIPGRRTLQDCSPIYSLVKKTLNGAGISPLVWNYAYSENRGGYANFGPSGGSLPLPVPPNVVPINSKSITITQPDGSSVKYYINRDATSPIENKVEATEYVDSTGAVLKRVMNYYAEGSVYGDPLSLNASNEKLDLQVAMMTKSVIEQEGDAFTTEYLNFDLYDVAQERSEYNSYSSNTRYSQFTYYNDIDNWLLSLPRISRAGDSLSNLIEYRETTYHPAAGGYKSLPNEVKIMGVWQSRADEYHADGNLKKIVYNGTNRYELFEDYKRGQAQKITLPCATTNGCSTANASTANTIVTLLTIDDNGWLQDTTDFKGNVVDYDYDPLGRLELIDPQDPFVANTTVSYSTVTSASDGISGSGVVAGMFKQTVSRGDYEKRVYHDTLLRPVFTREMDVSDAGTARYSRANFDYRNKPTFTSLASESVAATAGTDTVYDAIGRTTTVTRNTDNSVTSIVYLAENKVQVTDPKSNITTTQYLAYGTPDQSDPLEIVAPESVTTTIAYNPLGQTTSVSQGGITENRYYDSLQRLCKVNRPETGNTAYSYNARRQLEWFAEGASGSTTSCDTPSVEASKKVVISYNNQGEKDGIDYPDSAPDVSFGFDENGNLDNLTAGNVSHVYNYNNQDKLTRETLNIVESGYTKTLELVYGYNSLEHQIHQEYPNGDLVEFDVNALGQPLNARSYIGGVVDETYATNAAYYADDMLSGFTFGNGVIHSMTRDVNLHPERITDQLSSNKMMDLQYGYDQNLNITSLINHRDASFSLSNLSYDGLDRLKTTTGGSGIGSSSLTYDPLGNIKTYNSKNSNLTYTYDTGKNRLSSVSGSGSDAKSYAYFNYDDRGNVSHNSHRALVFNRANQMVGSEGNTYLYDGHNRRVKQVDGSGTSYSMYSQGGRLLYRETGVDSSTGIGDGVNYIFLGKKLIAKEGVFANTGSSLQHYKPYGETIEAPKDEVGYSGHKFDADLELSYMQARYYDPAIGRFYSNDPVGFTVTNPMSFNRYSYVFNNPYKFKDPDGRDARSFIENMFLGGPEKRQQSRTNVLASRVAEVARQVPGTAARMVEDGVEKLPSKAQVSVAAGHSSDALALVAVGAAFAGQAEVAVPAAALSGVLGVVSAALSPEPVKQLAIEGVTTVTGTKGIGTIADIGRGIAGNAKGVNNVIDGMEQLGQEVVSIVIEESANPER